MLGTVPLSDTTRTYISIPTHTHIHSSLAGYPPCLCPESPKTGPPLDLKQSAIYNVKKLGPPPFRPPSPPPPAQTWGSCNAALCPESGRLCQSKQLRGGETLDPTRCSWPITRVQIKNCVPAFLKITAIIEFSFGGFSVLVLDPAAISFAVVYDIYPSNRVLFFTQ